MRVVDWFKGLFRITHVIWTTYIDSCPLLTIIDSMKVNERHERKNVLALRTYQHEGLKMRLKSV